MLENVFTTSCSVCVQSNNHDQMNAYNIMHRQRSLAYAWSILINWQLMMATISTVLLPRVWSFYTLVHISVRQHPTCWPLPYTNVQDHTPEEI